MWLLFTTALLFLSRIPWIHSCPLSVWVYENAVDCVNQEPPDAIGSIDADGVCRDTEIERQWSTDSAALLLPGIYSAECREDGTVEFTQSGCSSLESCETAQDGMCTQEANSASILYSILNPPDSYLDVVPPAQQLVNCYDIQGTGTDGNFHSFSFAILGSCVDCVATLDTPAPSPQVNTLPTITSKVTQSPTTIPTVSPTPSPTTTPTAQPTEEEEGEEPTDNAGEPSPSPSTAEPSTNEPTTEDDGGFGPRPPTSAPSDDTTTTTTTAPTATIPPTTITGGNPSVAPANTTSQNNSPLGIIVGSVVGMLAVLALFLVGGFVIGKRSQQRKDAQSRSLEQSMQSAGTAKNPTLQTPPPVLVGSAIFEAATLSDNIISFDQDEADAVSALEDPTVMTGTGEDPTASVTAYDFTNAERTLQSMSTIKGEIENDEDSLEQLFNQS